MMVLYYESFSHQNTLSHHGILGQKWGQRNGPPYPLKASAHSSSENKAGWQNSLDKGQKEDDNKTASTSSKSDGSSKKGLTGNQKKAIKIGAAVVATALVAYGAFKLADSGELKRLAEKGKAFLNGTEATWAENPELANKNWTAEEIFKNVVGKINPGAGYTPGTSNNCRRCTFAYELNRRGFDVSATKTLHGTGQNEYGLINAIDNSGQKHTVLSELLGVLRNDPISRSHGENSFLNNRLFGTPIKLEKGKNQYRIFEALSQMPNGARGELSMKWSGGSGGHSMAWEIVNGKPVIFECQHTLKYDSSQSFASVASFVSNAAFTRLDNVDLNNDFLLKWVENTWK